MSKLKDNSNSILENLDQYDKELLEKLEQKAIGIQNELKSGKKIHNIDLDVIFSIDQTSAESKEMQDENMILKIQKRKLDKKLRDLTKQELQLQKKFNELKAQLLEDDDPLPIDQFKKMIQIGDEIQIFAQGTDDQFQMNVNKNLQVFWQIGQSNKFKVEKALNGNQNALSFSQILPNGQKGYIRHSNSTLFCHEYNDKDLFKWDSSFFLKQLQNGSSFQFESCNYRGYYITIRQDNRFLIDYNSKNILEKYFYSLKSKIDQKKFIDDNEIGKNLVQDFQNVSKDQFIFRNIFEQIKNNFKNQFDENVHNDPYLGRIVKNIENWSYQNFRSIAEMQIVNNELFIIFQEIGEVKQDVKVQCLIFYSIIKYDSSQKDFILVLKFLADILPYGHDKLSEILYMRLIINQQGIYFYKKDEEQKGQNQYLKCMFYSINNPQQQKDNLIPTFIQELSIKLPDQISLEQIDYGFITKGQKQYSDKIEDQYLIVQTYKLCKEYLFQIYSIKNTSQPIIQYQTRQLTRICISFFFEMENQVILILKSSEKQTHYQITYEKNSGCNYKDESENYKINEDPSLIIQNNYGKYDWGRHHDIQLDVLEIELNPQSLQIKTENENPFIQYYYISVYGLVELIYPSWDNSQKEVIKKIIYDKHKLNEKEGQIMRFYDDNEKYVLKKDSCQQLSNLMKQIGFNKYSDFVSSKIVFKNMIISLNRLNIYEVFIFQDKENDASDIKVKNIFNIK